jgi:hypothetical protein
MSAAITYRTYGTPHLLPTCFPLASATFLHFGPYHQLWAAYLSAYRTSYHFFRLKFPSMAQTKIVATSFWRSLLAIFLVVVPLLVFFPMQIMLLLLMIWVPVMFLERLNCNPKDQIDPMEKVVNEEYFRSALEVSVSHKLRYQRRAPSGGVSAEDEALGTWTEKHNVCIMLPRFLVGAASACIQVCMPAVVAQVVNWVSGRGWHLPPQADEAAAKAAAVRDGLYNRWKAFLVHFHKLQAVIWVAILAIAMTMAFFKKGDSEVLVLMLTLVFLTVLLYIKVVRSVVRKESTAATTSASTILCMWSVFFFLLAAFFFTAGSTSTSSADEAPFSEGLYSYDPSVGGGQIIPAFDSAQCARNTHHPVLNGTLPICKMQWSGLGIYDCALFAELAYHHPELSEVNERALQTDLQNWFCDDWEYEQLNKHVQNIHALVFRSKSNTTSVLSIAGTHMGTDVVLDLDIWMEASVMQFLGYVIPGFSLLPNSFYRNVIKIGALFETSFHSFHREFIVELEREVYKEKAKGRDVVVVGHSLGGGVAKIIGMLTETPAVSISGAAPFRLTHLIACSVQCNTLIVAILTPHCCNLL